MATLEQLVPSKIKPILGEIAANQGAAPIDPSALPGMALPPIVPLPTPPNVMVNPRLSVGDSGRSADPLIARKSDLMADLYNRENPNTLPPTTTLGKIGHVAGKIGGVLGDIFAPDVMANVPGTQLYNERIEARDKADLEGVSQEQTAESGRSAQAAQSAERTALAHKADTLADNNIPVPLTADEANAIGHPEFEGMALSPRDKAKFFGTVNTNDTRQTVGAGHDATRIATNTATNDTRETLAQAADKTRLLIANMRDSTSRANNENTVSHKGTAGADGNYKVPADVTKRAALADNVLENSKEAEALLDKSPDIVGAAGGRYTGIQQMIGSDDPNIAALGIRMHNIALASNGAHGLRSAEAVAATEKDLFNHFKSGPNAIKSALDATGSSMQTFLDDEKSFSTSGKRKSASSAPSGPPPGATHIVPGSDGHNHYTDGKNDLGVAP